LLDGNLSRLVLGAITKTSGSIKNEIKTNRVCHCKKSDMLNSGILEAQEMIFLSVVKQDSFFRRD